MRRILITGENSYVGKEIGNWLKRSPDKYLIDYLSLKTEKWKEFNFSDYDVVCHMAAIAHLKEIKHNSSLYFKVNRDLAYEVAKKSKIEGVNHFIFFSSMSVYGTESGMINDNVLANPTTYYGKSKLQAEKLINALDDIYFRVAIIRPPMIYGNGCKGNYTRLSNLALKLPIFPSLSNKRSMIFIKNLCEFTKIVIDDFLGGVFYPQNKELVSTSEMVRLIAEANGKKIKFVSMFNPLIRVCNNRTFNKVYGSLYYEKNMSKIEREYQIYNFEESIYLSERGNEDDIQHIRQ